MFGTLRLVLALTVALSHMGNFSILNLGVSSVVIFYLLSGYVMTYSFTNIFKLKLQNIGKFYLDRFMRIYPILTFYFIIVFCFLLITDFMNPTFTIVNVLVDLSVLPLNFFMYTKIGGITDPYYSILPSTWSLAVELQFYLLIPLLLYFKKIKFIAYGLSIVVFLLAAFGAINTDIFGYRLLPGILFIFLVGSLLYEIKTKENTKIEKVIVLYTAILVAIVTILLIILHKIKEPFTIEVSIGFIFGILLIYILSSVQSDQSSKKLDELLGGLSYPVFLSHYSTIWFMNYMIERHHLTMDGREKIIIQITLTFVLSVIGYFVVEKPAAKWRKRLREKRKLNTIIEKNINVSL